MLARYERHGREADLDEAITSYDAALAPTCLPLVRLQINRANALLTRDERHGREAGTWTRRSPATMPPSPTLTCLPLVAPLASMNRANALMSRRYERHGREADLDEAITSYDAALADPHLPAAGRPAYQIDLGERPADPLRAPRARGGPGRGDHQLRCRPCRPSPACH